MRFYNKFLLFFVSVTLNFSNIVANNLIISNDSTALVKVNKIFITGNKKTKEQIIRRELTFQEGISYHRYELEALIERSKEHLLKLPLFNYVTINKEVIGKDSVNIHIIVEERWYLWPEILIINHERNFNAWWETKDFSKLDYRFSLLQYNVFGLNHKARVGVSLGFTKEFYVRYENIFLDKKQRHFLNVKTSIYYRNKVFYRTFQNKRETYTSDKYAIQGSEFELSYNFRPEYYGTHFFSLAFLTQQIEDSLLILNPDFLGNDDEKLSFFQFTYNYSYDRRNKRAYPTTGFFLKGKIQEQGFGIFNKGFYNFSLYANYKQYYRINGKFYGAHSVSLKKTFDNYEVYNLKKGLGYNNDYLRGYEYYVIDGQDFFLIKNNLKFNILPKHIVNLKFLPLKKFQKIHFSIYINAYFDMGYVYDKYQNDAFMNTLSNEFQYSGGLGLDLVTYYDKIFRFEYSIIKTGEHGFFIHFLAPI